MGRKLTNNEELDPLVLDNLEVNRRAEVAHVDPPSSSLYRVLRPEKNEEIEARRKINRFSLENLALQPGEVVDAHSVLLPTDRHKDVLTLKHL